MGVSNVTNARITAAPTGRKEEKNVPFFPRMALNIKSEEADGLARELARRRGQPITRVIIDALRAELERERWREQAPSRLERMRAIAERAAALPVLDEASEEEILGYDDMLNPR